MRVGFGMSGALTLVVLGGTNTRREKSLLMNRMAYARKKITRNEKGNGKENRKF